MNRRRAATLQAYMCPACHDAIHYRSQSTVSSSARIADKIPITITDEGNTDAIVETFKDILNNLELEQTLH